MDGCFDMMHYGHCNALRQACALGDELIVGFISDDARKANKGTPVTALRERCGKISRRKKPPEKTDNRVCVYRW